MPCSYWSFPPYCCWCFILIYSWQSTVMVFAMLNGYVKMLYNYTGRGSEKERGKWEGGSSGLGEKDGGVGRRGSEEIEGGMWGDEKWGEGSDMMRGGDQRWGEGISSQPYTLVNIYRVCVSWAPRPSVPHVHALDLPTHHAHSLTHSANDRVTHPNHTRPMLFHSSYSPSSY